MSRSCINIVGLLSLAALWALPVGCGDRSEALKPMSRDELPEAPKVISLAFADVKPDEGYSLVDVYAVQLSYRLEDGLARVDSDYDGLSNFRESQHAREFKLNFKKADTNGDGYSDLLMLLGGFAAADQEGFRACSNPTQDTDLDMLTDCEENNLLHTDPKKADTDGDGVLDGLEVRNGLNPRMPGDATQDADDDGLSNKEEILANLPTFEKSADLMRLYGVRYSGFEESSHPSQVHTVQIDNIPLVPDPNGDQILVLFVTRNVENQLRVTRSLVKVPWSTTEKVIGLDYDEVEKQSN